MMKLFVCDVDNTLTEAAHTVPEENVRAIRRAIDAGVYVTIATGRGYLGASQIIEALGLDSYVICYGGAIIVDAKTAKPLFASEVKNELVHECLDLADEMGVHSQIYQGDTIVSAVNDIYTQKYIKKLNLPVRIEPEIRNMEWKQVPKVLWITDADKADVLIPQMQKHFEGRLKVSGSSPGFIEFNMLGVDKGTGIKRLAEHLGIDRKDVVAVGDNTLDLEMLQWAGTGVAVADAKEKIKKLADIIAPSCADCGVAWTIDKMLSEK